MTQIGPNDRSNRLPAPPSSSRAHETEASLITAPLSQPGKTQSSPQPSASGANSLISNGSPLGLNAALALNPGQLLQLLRSLLQLPKELVQLLAMLSNADPAAAQALMQELLQTLLNTETPAPLDDLQAALLAHADGAQEKLLKLLQTAGAGTGAHPGQLGELLGTLSELVSQARQSPGQALHAAIHLYLPYPLHPPQAFTLRQESASGEEDGDSGGSASEQLALYIETLTLGQFKITLNAQGRAPLQALVLHEPLATAFTATIAQEVAQGMGGNGQIEFFFTLKENAKAPAIPPDANPTHPAPDAAPASSPPKADSPQPNHENVPAGNEMQTVSSAEGKQSVGLHPTGGLSMTALYAAYVLIRVIFELDEQNQRHQQRAKF